MRSFSYPIEMDSLRLIAADKESNDDWIQLSWVFYAGGIKNGSKSF